MAGIITRYNIVSLLTELLFSFFPVFATDLILSNDIFMATLGGPAVINCEPSHNCIVEIQWCINGEVLNCDRPSLENNVTCHHYLNSCSSDLNFSMISEAQNGTTFQCSGKLLNSNKTISSNVGQLIIQGMYVCQTCSNRLIIATILCRTPSCCWITRSGVEHY